MLKTIPFLSESPVISGFLPEVHSYGFNGKELDSEGMGGGSSTYDYGFRIYNPALAKFLSVDPLTSAYPWYTPYQFAGNKPIIAIDLDGLEEYIQINIYNKKGDVSKIIMYSVKDIETGKPKDLGIWHNDKFKGAEGKAVAILHLTEELAEYSNPTFSDELSAEQSQISKGFNQTELELGKNSRGQSQWALAVPEAYKDDASSGTITETFDSGIVCCTFRRY